MITMIKDFMRGTPRAEVGMDVFFGGPGVRKIGTIIAIDSANRFVTVNFTKQADVEDYVGGSKLLKVTDINETRQTLSHHLMKLEQIHMPMFNASKVGQVTKAGGGSWKGLTL